MFGFSIFYQPGMGCNRSIVVEGSWLHLFLIFGTWIHVRQEVKEEGGEEGGGSRGGRTEEGRREGPTQPLKHWSTNDLVEVEVKAANARKAMHLDRCI